MNKLKIVTTEEGLKEPSRKTFSKPNNRVEREAYFERQWLENPEQFNPQNDACREIQQERLLEEIPECKTAIDLGCGWGDVVRKLSGKGVEVTGLDIASNALKRLPGFKVIKGTLPFKTVEEKFDVVIAANLIAEIPDNERRLAVSEMAELLAKGGKAVISTPIDVDSEDGLVRFISLIETEFDIEDLRFSYFFLAQKFPFVKRWKRLLSWSEEISNFFWQDRAITDVIAVCHVKRLVMPSETPVVERAQKKTVWE